MDSVSEGNITNSRDHMSIHSDLCWQDQPVQVELGSPSIRSLGHSDSISGLSHPLHVCPLSEPPSLQPSPVQRGHYNIEGGDRVSPVEAGDSMQPQFYSNIFMSKKDGGETPVINLKKSEQICEIKPFQNGGATHSQSSLETKRLDGQSGPQRCLLHGPNSPPTLLQDGEENIPFQLSSLWSLHSPKGLHKNTQAIHGD